MTTPMEALRELAESHKGRGDDCGVLARAVLAVVEVEAAQLADLLLEVLCEANSRGRLSPGGYDANTPLGHKYNEALTYLADHGYPC